MSGAGPRGMAAASLVAVGLLVAACAEAPSAAPGPPRAAVGGAAARARTTASTGGLPEVTVTDRSGARFTVTASPVTWSVVVTANSFLWSAAPGQNFLVDNLTVTNPTAQAENLADFDDLTSGLSADVAFVVGASRAATLGYGADCGVDPTYPADLCPISYGQELTVDSDAADHAGASAVVLAPGASDKLTVSYGPVLADVVPSDVSAYFEGGSSPPVDLTP